MSFTKSIVTCFSKFADFSGRASRSEYWWFQIFRILIGFVTAFADVLIFHDQVYEHDLFPINTFVSLVLFAPLIAVIVRRLHDVNRSGWWILIQFTIIGLIPLLYWIFSKGTDGPNDYGDDPLADSEKYVLGEMKHDFSVSSSVESNFVSCEKSAN